MALVSKKTGKPSNNMREELIAEEDYGKPPAPEADHELKEHNRKMDTLAEILKTPGRMIYGEGRHREHR